MALDLRILDLIATVVERLEGPRGSGPGHPPAETVRVLATLRRFLREGTPWRSLRATSAQASGSTLRRRLADWAEVNLLQRVHALLVAMLRGDPDLILDSCSVRAKRGGDLTGPNPTDRGKAGTKYHIVASTDGIPLGVVPSAANVHDTRLFPHLLRLALAVCAAIGRLYADAAYDSADNRGLCAREGIQPFVREVGQPHGSGLGTVRCIVEHDCARLLANKRLDRRHDRLGRMILALLTAACIFVVANRLDPF